MKVLVNKFLNPGNYSVTGSFALLFIRVAVGLLMLTHGWGKLMMLFGSDPIQFPDPIGLGVTLSYSLVVFAEFFCSLLLIFGVGVRFAGITLLINMLVAVLVVHGNDPLAVKELALIYAAIYAFLIIAGAGKFSVDSLLVKKCKG